MRTWYTMHWYTVSYGYDAAKNDVGWTVGGNTVLFSVSHESLEAALAGVRDFCDKNQNIIKGIVPLTTSIGHCNYNFNHEISKSYAYGYGFGVSQHTGFVVVAQQEEFITDEEYSIRLERIRLKDAMHRIQVRLDDIKGEISKMESESFEIVESKNWILGVSYIFRGEKFSKESDATVRKNSIISKISELKVEQNALNEELNAVIEKIKNLGES